MDEKKVSLIIPIYNVELYLRECLESAINQTLEDIEIICINDGSPDNSLEIVEEYAARDNRIKIINQSNQGLSDARNAGMKVADGKYISFLDGDDYLKKDALETLYNLAERENLDHIIFEAEVFYDEFVPLNDTWTSYYMHKNHYGQIKSGKECFYDLVINKDYVYGAQLRFSLRSRLEEKKILFKSHMIHEDNLFTFINDFSAERAMILDEKLYMMRKRPDSITTGKTTMNHAIGYFVAYIESLKYARKACYSNGIKKAIDIDLNRKYHNACKDYVRVEDKNCLDEQYLGCVEAKALLPIIGKSDVLMESKIETNNEIVRKPIVSVIVPVYNVQDYLAECLESLRTQTLKEIEIICVDDGSNDNSLIILKYFSLLDSRFKILNMSNKGAGAARNFGMRFAFGKYLAFFDSDDWADKTFLEEMVEKAEQENSDVVVSRSFRYSQCQKEVVRETKFNKEYVLENGPITYQKVGNRLLIDFGNQPWAKLFRRSFIQKNEIRFQEIVRSNDLFFTQTAVVLAKALSIVDKALYFYRIDIPNTLQSTNDETPTIFLEAWKMFKNRMIAEDKLDDIKISLANAVWNGCIFTFGRLQTKKAKKRLFDELKNGGLSEFEIDSLTEENCLNNRNYAELKRIKMAFSIDEYLGK